MLVAGCLMFGVYDYVDGGCRLLLVVVICGCVTFWFCLVCVFGVISVLLRGW